VRSARVNIEILHASSRVKAGRCKRDWLPFAAASRRKQKQIQLIESFLNKQAKHICAENIAIRARCRALWKKSKEGDLERVKGIEPSYSAWKAAALPLSYTRDTWNR
jgi:hypothetical protein